MASYMTNPRLPILQKLSHYLDEAMDTPVSQEKEELLKEKMKNLLGILMGCQQEIATIETKIEQELNFVAEEERKGIKDDMKLRLSKHKFKVSPSIIGPIYARCSRGL